MELKTFSSFRLRVLLLFSFCAYSMVASSQELAVTSFQHLPNDMTARALEPVKDSNGDLTALLKIVTGEADFVFDGGSLGIVKTSQKVGEWWVYVPAGARKLTILHPSMGVLRNYAYPLPIEAGNVYEMKLVHGTVEVIVKEAKLLSEFVIITSEPPGADVYINNEPMGKTRFEAEKPEGKYEWRVEHEKYLPQAGVFEVKAGEKVRLDLTLEPNYGTLKLVSQPEPGASISINGFSTGKSTPATLEEVPTGEHTMTLTHEWYETTTEKVRIAAGETKELGVTMQPNYAELTINANDDEEVFVNGSSKGKGKHNERVVPGVYRVEVRKASHAPATKQLTLSRGDRETVELTPTPILSSLKVTSDPSDAEIYLDGKRVGTTPQIVRELLIGDYEIELRKNGYGSSSETVTVKEGETVEVNETLESTGGINITTEPTGAEVYNNGDYLGMTPYSATGLTAGTYRFELRKQGYETVTASVAVEPGKTSEAFKQLKSTRKPYEPEMVFVEGGTFTMGCTSEQSDCDDDENPTHRVTVSSFQMGKYEVTQAQWRAVMGGNPSHFSGCDDCPVEKVSWNDIQEFIRKLNRQTGKNYRLPTEAEWEYAARGGNKSKGYKFSGSNDLGRVAWYDDNSGSKTHPVGQKQANELGIYDMTGNVYEWCEDWYGDYSRSSQTNPKGPVSGSPRVLRGGSWYYFARYCRVSNRGIDFPAYRSSYYGFRLVLP